MLSFNQPYLPNYNFSIKVFFVVTVHRSYIIIILSIQQITNISIRRHLSLTFPYCLYTEQHCQKKVLTARESRV